MKIKDFVDDSVVAVETGDLAEPILEFQNSKTIEHSHDDSNSSNQNYIKLWSNLIIIVKPCILPANRPLAITSCHARYNIATVAIRHVGAPK